MGRTVITAEEFNEFYSKYIKGQRLLLFNPEHRATKYYDNLYLFDSNQKGYYKEIIFKNFPVFENRKPSRMNKHFIINAWGDTTPKVRKDGIGRLAINDLKKYCAIYKEDFEFKDNKKFVKYNDKEVNVVANMYNYLNSKIPRDTWIKGCYGYDMNSCFPSFLSKPLPYGDIHRRDGIVQDDELGFNSSITSALENSYELVLPGGYAQIIFKSKVYQGFVDYAISEYRHKKKAAESEYEDIKEKYNAMLGNMKYHNIFIRIAVLGYAYKYMESLKDENTIMQTVDSIVSLTPRPDLDIGDGLGQFKVEHENEPFIFKSHAIKKWYGSKTSYKGMLRDAIDGNFIYTEPLYFFDIESRKFKKNKNRKKERLWPELENINNILQK